MSTPQYTKEYCDLVNTLREFEQAHVHWMSLSVFTPEGKAAKQFKDSSMSRYMEAYRIWQKAKRHDDERTV